jgi:hypothetical protein
MHFDKTWKVYFESNEIVDNLFVKYQQYHQLSFSINQTNTTKASQILNLPNYIALTPNHRHFTTFNYDTLYGCDFNNYITCDISLPLPGTETFTMFLK